MKKTLVTSLEQLVDGALVECRIESSRGVHNIKNAEVSVTARGIFICQNAADGNDCANKKGFKYSWLFGGADCIEDKGLCTPSVDRLYLLEDVAKRIHDKPKHQGWKWKGNRFKKDSINDATLLEIQAMLEEHRAEVKRFNGLLRDHKRLSKRGW